VTGPDAGLNARPTKVLLPALRATQTVLPFGGGCPSPVANVPSLVQLAVPLMATPRFMTGYMSGDGVLKALKRIPISCPLVAPDVEV
jgi:hypothetical protein